jgi:hypothetical protein
LVLLMLNTFAAFNQNLSVDLKRSSKYLAALASFKFTVRIDIYEDLMDSKPYMNMDGKILKSDNFYWNEIDGKEFFTDQLNCVIVDHNEKQVSYNKASKGSIDRQLAQHNLFGAIDSLALITDSVIYNGVKQGAKEYVILQKGALIHTTLVQIDSATGVLKKIIYLYDIEEMETNNKVVAYYDLSAEITEQEKEKLKLSSYLYFVSNQPKLSSRFKGYSLKN